jgi:uncharacterized protein (TIGR01777 family)
VVEPDDGVIRLDRCPQPSREAAALWNPAARTIEAEALEGADAVIHLAGESVASGRWTPEKKRRIRDSRVEGTRFLCEALGRLAKPPRVLLSASAIGYYGDRGDAELREAGGQGEGFLAEVCGEWERATGSAEADGIRVVHLRLGIVLTPAGGALGKMLPPFQLGIGGRLGTGRQFMSWIAMDDVIGAVSHALVTDEIRGAVNVVSPNPATNAEFTRTLGRVLRRPALLPVPAAVLRILFGELADEGLLASARVVPDRLLQTGYRFRYPHLDGALRHLLGRT